MKKLLLLVMLLPFAAMAQEWKPGEWPILKSYDQNHLYNIALPLGGIGTGTVSLGGRGELRDWEVMNIPARKFSTVTTGNDAPCFVMYVNVPDSIKITKALIGPVHEAEYLHYDGRPVDQHGFPRFAHATFDAAYPFGQVNLWDESVPVQVKVKGFNPLVPADEDASSYPAAIITYEVHNPTAKAIEVSVCGSARNFIGKDGSQFVTDWKGDNIPTGAKNNKNIYKESENVRGIYMYSDSVSKTSPAWGTVAITTNAKQGISYRTASRNNAWANSALAFWDDFSDDGILEEKYKITENDPMASLAVKKTIAPGSTESFTFFITWTFPNRIAWSTNKEVVGNYYTTKFKDAWDVAEKLVSELPALESNTLKFVNAFISSDIPAVAKEAALFNLNVLRSQTVFRLPSGHLMGWEGVMDRFGSCAGSCTHVWNYETATPFLFGDLARTMRDVELNYATMADGKMYFRASLPLTKPQLYNGAAADGQMGCIMKIYREWQLSGDNEFLKKNWEHTKLALSYAWTPDSWDANQDGVMEGSQHNTMDVNYSGPNPQMQFWYLGALKAAAQMADFMKDKDFAKKCRTLYANGSEWTDKNLFNGEYYEHQILDFQTKVPLNPDTDADRIPAYQLGRGCLVDQLVGQYMAHIVGLGYLGNPQNMQTTLKSIMAYNYMPSFANHFNNMRSYVIGNEAGLLMASWPKGRLVIPFPYFGEVMTGFEYCAAVGMIYEGQVDNALLCVQNIRDRHDGAKRNPFSEPECGHHYARSMASWSLVLALTDFHYSAVDKAMTITSKPGTYFWSNGYAWGTCKVETDKATINVMKGNLALKSLTLKDMPAKNFREVQINEGTERVINL